MVTLALIAGGVILKQDRHAAGEGEKISQSKNAKAEMIRALFELKDDDHEATALHKSAPTQAPQIDQETGFPALVKIGDTQASIHENHEHLHHGHSDSVSQIEDDEEARALASESQMLATSDVVEAKHKAAADDLKFQHQRLASQHNAHYLKYISKLAKDVRPEDEELGSFNKVLTRCSITGHNAHWINQDTGWILRHLKIDDPMAGYEAQAREIVKDNYLVAVIVYDNGLEIYDRSGKLIKSERR